jgi:hypothetical protein
MIKCLTASLALGLALIPAAHAQSTTRIYRCGGPQGRVFSQLPCRDFKRAAQPIDIHDRRTDAQHADAKKLAQSEARQALMLEKTRLAQAAAKAPTPAVHLSHPAVPSPIEKLPRQRSAAVQKNSSPYFKAITPKTAAPEAPR